MEMARKDGKVKGEREKVSAGRMENPLRFEGKFVEL
jgi:hypothetical protein